MARLLPNPMTRDQLVAILDDMCSRVAAGDSMEGSITYSMPFGEDGKVIEDAEFLVEASYRLGNLQGQGSLRIIGRFPPSIVDGPPI